MKTPKKAIIIYVIFTALLATSLVFNYIEYKKIPHKILLLTKLDADDRIVMKNIENYMDSISSSLIKDVKELAKAYNVKSWGCGPTTYALGHIINQKFFNNKAPYVAAYDNKPYEIVQRFSLAQGNPYNEPGGNNVDHSWLEIYFKDKMLFIDPTIGQFGRFNKIVYEEFKVGDPEITKILNDKYGITDMRIRRLVKKAVDRVPKDQEPYPGASILPADLSYFQKVALDANAVDAGEEPEGYKIWVDTLLARFQ